MEKYFPETNIYGYDISLESLAIAKKTNPNAQFITEDSLDKYANMFDIILIANVFHHIPYQYQHSAMQTAKLLLRASGEIFIVEHNPYNLMTLRAVNTCEFDKNAVLLKPNVMKALVRETGLDIINQGYTLFFPTSIRYFQPVEKYMSGLPFGAQYYIQAQKR